MTTPFDDRYDPPTVDEAEPEPIKLDFPPDDHPAPSADDRGMPAWAEELLATQAALHEGFERLATAVTPLLTKQFREIEARNRAYEQRLKLRQERPLIVKMSSLLNDVRRLTSEADIRSHVESTVEAILTDLGYQPFGNVGDPYVPAAYEAIGGRMAKGAVVTAVHATGLQCYGDVIVRARVDVGPPPSSPPPPPRQQPDGGDRPTEVQKDRTHAAHRD